MCHPPNLFATPIARRSGHNSGAGTAVPCPYKRPARFGGARRSRRGGIAARSGRGGLAHADNDHGHVVSLLWRAGPLFGGEDEALGQHGGELVTLPNHLRLQPFRPEFLAIHVLRLREAITIGDEQRSGHDIDRFLSVASFFEKAHNRASLIKLLDVAIDYKKRAKMARIR